MARPLRSLLPDGIYHGMSRGVDGCAIYRSDDDYVRFLRMLAGVVDTFGWVMYALCLMPNHYHLVFATTRARLSDGMQRLNGRYAARFNREHARTGHLFGDRFAVRIVEDEEYLTNLCHYVLANPVRAGLASDTAGWRWAHSRFGLQE
jgi:REP element-mobilizing transposase RayT